MPFISPKSTVRSKHSTTRKKFMEINIDDIEGTGSVTSESLSDNDGED